METLTLDTLAWFAVHIVAKHRMTYVSHMNAYLMSTPRFKAAADMSVAAVLLYHAVVSYGIP